MALLVNRHFVNRSEGHYTSDVKVRPAVIDRHTQPLRSPANMGALSTQTPECNAFIHPLFRREKFPTIDAKTYDHIIRRPAVLASRLLDSPQALHYCYVTYFGRNTRLPDTWQECYGSNIKSPSELSSLDIEATRKQLSLLAGRVSFKFAELEEDGCLVRLCCACSLVPGVRGCDSVIKLGTQLYVMAQNKERTDRQNANVDFTVAAVMLHELGHAIHHDITGHAYEDYFEESYVAEAGFELVTRIFGLCPKPLTDGSKDVDWFTWQSSILRDAGYDLDTICCQQHKLGSMVLYRDETSDFILDLFKKEFWDGDYAKSGSVALLPPPVVDLCHKGLSLKEGPSLKAWLALPTSVRMLWMDSKGIRYYKERIPRLDNEEYEIRKPASETEDDAA